MRRFACVDHQKAAGFPLTMACEAAGVSTSGYYDRCSRDAAGPTERQLAEAELVALMRVLFDEADGNYGDISDRATARSPAACAANYCRRTEAALPTRPAWPIHSCRRSSSKC